MQSRFAVSVRSGIILFVLGGLALPALLRAAEPPEPPGKNPLAGAWQGALKIGAIELRLVLKVRPQPDGELKATLDSPDQGANDIPVDKVELDGRKVRVEQERLSASFDGELSEDGQQIEGHWKQGGLSLPLTLKRLEKEPDYRRPQEPRKPYPYKEEELVYENGQAAIKLAGTLTLPEADGPVPAVLLISGSGAQDRDESLLGHKPFLVLADYLTRRGIAVLRVDDRGVGGSTGKLEDATTEDLAGDALAGVEYLKGRAEIDSAKIGLVGHSEGGLIAPLAASRSPDVAFVVIMAGTGVTGEEILYRQGELIAKASGANDVAAALLREQQRRMFEIVKGEPDPAAAHAKLMEILAEQLSAIGDDAAASKESLKAQGEAQLKSLLSPWFRFFLTYDPRQALGKMTCPVLIINGEKDLQVDPRQNLPAIEAALKAAAHKDYTIQELSGLNHLFQTCQTGAPSEYGKIDETFSPAALELIGNWIVQRTSPPQPPEDQ